MRLTPDPGMGDLRGVLGGVGAIMMLGGGAGYGESFRNRKPFSGDASRDEYALWVPVWWREERVRLEWRERRPRVPPSGGASLLLENDLVRAWRAREILLTCSSLSEETPEVAVDADEVRGSAMCKGPGLGALIDVEHTTAAAEGESAMTGTATGGGR